MTYRAGIIGCGSIAAAHARAYQGVPGVELVAAADPVERARRELQERFGLPRAYPDATEMLQAEQLDLVSVCLWHPLHAEFTLLAARHRPKAIICEKPMATCLAEADAMVAACEAHGVKLAIGHMRRFNRSWTRARELLAEGTIGAPLFASVETGDGLLNCGTHVVDAIRYLLGDPETDWVMGAVERKTDRWERGVRMEDCCLGLVQFRPTTNDERPTTNDRPEGTRPTTTDRPEGTRPTTNDQGSGPSADTGEAGAGPRPNAGHPMPNAPRPRPNAQGPAPNTRHPIPNVGPQALIRCDLTGTNQVEDFSVRGSDGLLEVKQREVRLLRGSSGGWEVIETGYEDPWMAQARELVTWVEGTTGHRGAAEHGRAALEILMAVYQSAREHAMVRMPLIETENPLDRMFEEGKLAIHEPGRYDIRAFLAFEPEERERYKELLRQGRHPREILRAMGR
jgi:predicted dehydrogenase